MVTGKPFENQKFVSSFLLVNFSTSLDYVFYIRKNYKSAFFIIKLSNLAEKFGHDFEWLYFLYKMV
jgi:hypothetical protein